MITLLFIAGSAARLAAPAERVLAAGLHPPQATAPSELFSAAKLYPACCGLQLAKQAKAEARAEGSGGGAADGPLRGHQSLSGGGHADGAPLLRGLSAGVGDQGCGAFKNIRQPF